MYISPIKYIKKFRLKAVKMLLNVSDLFDIEIGLLLFSSINQTNNQSINQLINQSLLSSFILALESYHEKFTKQLQKKGSNHVSRKNKFYSRFAKHKKRGSPSSFVNRQHDIA